MKISKDFKSKVGPVLNPPLKFKNNYYILSLGGYLFKTSQSYDKGEALFQTVNSSTSGIERYGDHLYFGDGIHGDEKSYFYKFDLKKNVLAQRIEFEGHLEKTPLIEQGVAYLGLGKSGAAAIRVTDMKVLWKNSGSDGLKFHVDSIPVSTKDKVCFGSVYGFIGIICLNKKDGTLLSKLSTSFPPKGEFLKVNSLLIGFATEANLTDPKWKTPSELIVYDMSKSKKVYSKSLRGFNFFGPIAVNGQTIGFSLSTGELLTLNLKTKSINLLIDFPEPQVSSPFLTKGKLCSIGVMGRLSCFKMKNGSYVLDNTKRLFETVIGSISSMNGNVVFLPTRTGHHILEL